MKIALKDHSMNAGAPYGHLLALAHRLLESLTAPVLAPFLAGWPVSADERGAENIGPTPRGADAAAALPVLRWLPDVAADACAFASALVAALCETAPLLTWRQTYTSRELGMAFMQNYGWTEILGPRGSPTNGQVACGLLLLGPKTLYPLHRHEAEEIYVPLRGTADWQQGDAVWRPRLPGTLIHHRSEEPHAMRTGASPLLALYLWQSANLSQHAQLDRQGAA
jgi:hypothetical protein